MGFKFKIKSFLVKSRIFYGGETIIVEKYNIRRKIERPK